MHRSVLGGHHCIYNRLKSFLHFILLLWYFQQPPPPTTTRRRRECKKAALAVHSPLLLLLLQFILICFDIFCCCPSVRYWFGRSGKFLESFLLLYHVLSFFHPWKMLLCCYRIDSILSVTVSNSDVFIIAAWEAVSFLSFNLPHDYPIFLFVCSHRLLYCTRVVCIVSQSVVVYCFNPLLLYIVEICSSRIYIMLAVVHLLSTYSNTSIDVI